MFAVTLMIISAVVGAGFATGAELATFFGDSTLPPVAIAVVVGIALFCMMLSLIYLPKDFNKKLFSPVFFVFFTAMTAGVTELAGPLCAFVAVIISVMIVIFGFERMLTANKILMGFALIVLLVTIILNFGGNLPKTNLKSNGIKTVGFALLYAGMNCCLLPAVVSESKKTLTRKELVICSLVATSVVCIFVLLILSVILANGVSSSSMPILEVSNNLFIKTSVFICILTSMFAALFNMSRGINNSKQLSSSIPSTKSNKVLLIIIGILGYAFSFLGFTKVIGVFYPIVGAIMILYIIFSFCFYLKGCYACRRNRVR